MARTFGGLIFALFVVFAAGYPPRSTASSNPSYDAALANCQGWIADSGYAAACVTSPPLPTDCVGRIPSQVAVIAYKVHVPGYSPVCQPFPFAGDPPSRCEAAPSYPASYGSNISVCNQGCMYKPDADASSDSVHGSGGYFARRTSGMYRATGAECGVGVPDSPPATGRLCGGGSCYDAVTGNYCAVGSAGQVCVHGPAPGASGGCASGGDTTLCAGNPPPLPPNPPVADPATDIGASDSYGHSSGGGTINNTTVNNYGSGGNPPNSGADSTAGDTAPTKPPTDPAGSSSTSAPKDPTSASGGGDCNTPPVCEGAAATCMVVKQTYLLRCPPGSQGQGQGPGEGDGDTTVPGLDDVGDSPGSGFMKSESLLDKLDQGGFMGGGTCPKLLTIDIDQFDVHSDSASLPWCDILGKVRWLLLLLAAYSSYRILSEK